jgi:hypothetical protein
VLNFLRRETCIKICVINDEFLLMIKEAHKIYMKMKQVDNVFAKQNDFKIKASVRLKTTLYDEY